MVAYPLGRVSWVYFRRRFEALGHPVTVVTLRAPYDAIVAPRRGRRFDDGEIARIAEMIAEGYGERPFSDLIVDTDARGFDETVAEIVARLGA